MENSISSNATLHSYEEMLKCAFESMHSANIGSTASKKLSLPAIGLTKKAKKTIFTNFVEICRILKRDVEHVKQYICTEQNAEASIDGNGGLVISGRLQSTTIEKLINQYVNQFVKCPVCGSTNTELEKRNRLLFILCKQCTAQRSINQIRAGYKFNTKKRSKR